MVVGRSASEFTIEQYAYTSEHKCLEITLTADLVYEPDIQNNEEIPHIILRQSNPIYLARKCFLRELELFEGGAL